MADTLRMSFSLTPVEQIDVGNSQTHDVIDSVSQRSWGGTFSRIYDADSDGTESSGKIAVFEGVAPIVTDAASDVTDGLDAYVWTDASGTTRGSLPSLAKVIAVEYVSSVGAENNYVYVYWSNEAAGHKVCFAKLLPGEGCVIPLEEVVAYGAAITGAADIITTGGIAPAKLHITVDTAYSDGVDEATINVLLAGR